MNTQYITITFKVVIEMLLIYLVKSIIGGSNTRIKNIIEEDEIKAFSIHGYDIKITCKTITYECGYKRFFIPNRKRKVYEVYSYVSSNAPTILINASRLRLTFPKLGCWFYPEELQKEQAVNAYLDTIKNELK